MEPSGGSAPGGSPQGGEVGASDGGAAGALNDACAPHVRWAKAFGDASTQQPDALVMDDSGAVTISGTFSGKLDFGGTPLQGTLNGDVFVARFDASGNHLVSLSFGGQGQPDTAFGLATDSTGAMLVTGYVTGDVDFGGGLLASASPTSFAYVAKYDAAAKYVFGRRFDGQYAGQGNAVTVDASDNVIAVGVAAAGSDFGGGPDALGNMFVAKYAPDGTYLWSKHFGGSQYGVHPESVRSDAAGNLVVAGYVVGGPVDFGGGPLPRGGGSIIATDVFLLGLDKNGNHRYSYVFGGTGDDTCFAMAIDAQGRSYLGGAFEAAVDFGGGSLNSAGASDAYWASYTADGAHRFSRRFGDAEFQNVAAIAADDAGNSVLLGSARGTFDFGGPLPGKGQSGMFWARLNPSGEHLCSQLYPVGAQSYPRAVGLSSKALAITGATFGGIDFGSGPLASQGGLDVFVAVLEF